MLGSFPLAECSPIASRGQPHLPAPPLHFTILKGRASVAQRLRPIHLMCRATSPSARVICQLPHDT